MRVRDRFILFLCVGIVWLACGVCVWCVCVVCYVMLWYGMVEVLCRHKEEGKTKILVFVLSIERFFFVCVFIWCLLNKRLIKRNRHKKAGTICTRQ